MRRTSYAALGLIGLAFAGPAFAQTSSAPTGAPPTGAPSMKAPAMAAPATPAPAMAPATGAAPPASAGVDSDDAFMNGLRRIGVMAGEVIQCTAEGDRKTPIDDGMQLANQVALHFGLAAAFNFTGAMGYGAGKPFDKAGCADATSGWNDIKHKYLNQ